MGRDRRGTENELIGTSVPLADKRVFCPSHLFDTLFPMAGPGTGILSFGLVAIPVRLYSAIKDQGVHFHYLHNKCGSRIQNQVFCPKCNQIVERSDLIRGYEFAKNEYIKFT